MDFYEIFTQRRTKEHRDKDAISCPFCGSLDIYMEYGFSTNVGYFGEDFNHKWQSCICRSCKEVFTRESKGPYTVWYTQRRNDLNYVLKGVPGCYEGYVYTCAKCGGDVHKIVTKLDGKTEVDSFRIEYGVKQYRVFYNCKKCGHGGETPEDYMPEERG